MESSSQKLGLDQFLKLKDEGCVIIDTRPPAQIKKGYVFEAICIPITVSGSYTTWIEGVVGKNEGVLLVCESGKEPEVLSNLAELEYTNVKGYLEGGFETWVNAGKHVQEYTCIAPKDMASKLKDKPFVIDVRDKSAWEQGVLEGAQLISLSNLVSRLNEVPKDQPVYVHCSTGGRSMSAYTVLIAKGYQNAVDIEGGVKNVAANGAQLVKPTNI